MLGKERKGWKANEEKDGKESEKGWEGEERKVKGKGGKQVKKSMRRKRK